MQYQIEQRIVVDPGVMAGKPTIRGTRIPVELIVRMLAQGIEEEAILDEYPNLASFCCETREPSHFAYISDI